MPTAKVNYVLAASLVAQGLTYDAAAADPRVNSANGESLRRGLARKGVTATQARSAKAEQLVTASVTLKLARQTAEVLRGQQGEMLKDVTDKLAELEVESNYKSLKQFGEVAEPIVRMSKMVEGWDSGAGGTGTVQFSSQDDSELDALDVQSTCVPEATTGSVPQKTLENQTPQEDNPQ